MKLRHIELETWVERPLNEVFEFFSLAENLQALTPDFLSFEILTPLPVEMRKGTLIDYRIRLGLFPMKWRTLISAWEPPYRFIDEQLKGPYRRWVHEHTFESHDGGTLIRDRVEYAVPGYVLEPLIHRLFVAPRLRQIFDFRADAIKRRFSS